MNLINQFNWRNLIFIFLISHKMPLEKGVSGCTVFYALKVNKPGELRTVQLKVIKKHRRISCFKEN